jgi:hypothetical protein
MIQWALNLKQIWEVKLIIQCAVKLMQIWEVKLMLQCAFKLKPRIVSLI